MLSTSLQKWDWINICWLMSEERTFHVVFLHLSQVTSMQWLTGLGRSYFIVVGFRGVRTEIPRRISVALYRSSIADNVSIQRQCLSESSEMRDIMCLDPYQANTLDILQDISDDKNYSNLLIKKIKDLSTFRSFRCWLWEARSNDQIQWIQFWHVFDSLWPFLTPLI